VVPGVRAVLSRFGVVVGPSIHVMSMCRRVIRRECFTWIDDVIDPGESHVAASHWLEPELLGLNVHGFLSFPMLNTCIRIDIATCGND